MAPEILIEYTKNKIIYTKRVDVWCLGILVYFLFCKNYPFYGSDLESIY